MLARQAGFKYASEFGNKLVDPFFELEIAPLLENVLKMSRVLIDMRRLGSLKQLNVDPESTIMVSGARMSSTPTWQNW